MNEPLISIITPSYNQGKYIEETILSVINQTYRNIEYIIMDGCSTDETREVLEKYKDNNNIKIYIEKDKGQTDAINKGFKMAKGELVGWINSDDKLKPDCIQNIVEEYYKNKSASIFYGSIDFIDENGRKMKSKEIHEVDYNYLLNVNPDINQIGSFYNTEYVRNIGYLNETINFTMDYDLWLKLLKINKGIKLNKILGEFRMQSASKTMTHGNAIKFWKDIFKIRKENHSDKRKIFSKIHIRFYKWCLIAAINRFGIKVEIK